MYVGIRGNTRRRDTRVNRYERCSILSLSRSLLSLSLSLSLSDVSENMMTMMAWCMAKVHGEWLHGTLLATLDLIRLNVGTDCFGNSYAAVVGCGVVHFSYRWGCRLCIFSKFTFIFFFDEFP